MRVLVSAVLVMSVAMFTAKAFIDARILEPARRREAAAAAAVDGGAAGAGDAGAKKAAGKKKKAKGSFAENFAVLKGSEKIRNLALLVMSYGVAHRWGAVWRRLGGMRGPEELNRRWSGLPLGRNDDGRALHGWGFN
jgi:ATP/ADP translocase